MYVDPEAPDYNNTFFKKSVQNVLLQKLAELAAEQGAEFVTLFSGEGVSEEDANAACELFTQCCADAEVSALPGGQPVYYYIISIE